MDININISKTHVFAETFFKKRSFKTKNAASGTLIFNFTSTGLVVVLVDGSTEQARVKNFLRLETDTFKPDPERQKALADYIASVGAHTARVIAVTSDGVSFRQLTMPAMPDADLKQAAAWELKKKFFINPEEQLIGILSVHDLEGEEGPEKLVSVFYMDKKLSLARLSILSGLGLSISSFWPGQPALSRLAAHQTGKEEGDIAVVDLAGPQVRISMVQKGLTMLSRAAQTGAIGTALPETLYSKIADEIQRSIDFYETQKIARPITEILITGSGYDAESLQNFLVSKFTAKISNVDGTRYVSDTLSEEQRRVLTSQPGLFAEALGALFVREEPLNLLPDEIHTHNRRRQLDQSMRKVFLMTACVLVFWVAWIGVQSQILSAQVGFANTEWKEIQTGKSAFTEIMFQEKQRRHALKGDVDLPALLKELSRLTPSPIVLKSLKFSRDLGTFNLSGVVRDDGNEDVKLITQYVGNLNASPFFQSVTLGQTMEEGGEGGVHFQVDATVKSVI